MKLFNRFRFPLTNPVRLQKIQQMLFSKKRPKITYKTVLKSLAWGLGGLVLFLILVFAWFSKDLPTPGRIKNLQSESSTRLYDRNMQPLYTISGEKKRILIEDKDIPLLMKQATIALEDKDFYKHPGVDPKGILRAAFTGVGGGSTLTQQLVKNTLLSGERTYTRKAKEAILAMELEVLYSKEQILDMYLNQVAYGGNNYGVEAASKSYFDKSVKDLSLAQLATLASIPQAPTTLSPYGKYTDRLIARRDKTINNMLAQGFITQEQADQAKAEKLAVVAKKDSITAPHFVLYVKEWLVDYFTTELKDRQLAEQKVESGGLSVVTTLDLPTQKIAEDTVSANAEKLKKYQASNAAMVSVDPKRGEVIALVGSVDYFKEGFGNYDVATSSPGRQPGSSMKPLIYATGFKDKYNPGYNIYDVKTDFGNYTPENYDDRTRGPISIRQALGNSLNIPAVKMLGLVGIDKALQTISDFGITTVTDKDRYGLSLALGAAEVKPIEMAGAYGVFANGGVYIPTVPVLEIKDQKNNVIYSHREPKDGKVVIDPQAAYEVTSILSDPKAKKPIFNGMLGVLTLGNRPAAVKTGTTNDYRDAWTIGYTPQLSTAVWVGNNDNSVLSRSGGAVAAAPIWHDFMQKALASQPIENFNRPAGIQELVVDKLSNKLPNEMSDTTKDIFASYQVPTERDDVHVKIRVCKENGLIADSNVADELAENRVFTNIHSEKPDFPNWEGPVIAWAQASGLYNPAPKQKCSPGEVKPAVTVTAPKDGETVTGIMTISAEGSASSGVKSIELYIDSVSVANLVSSPFTTTYDTNKLSSGSHTLKAVMTSQSGSTATDQISFVVGKDTTAPQNVSGMTVSTIGIGSVNVSWSNPESSDFAGVNVYVVTDPSGSSVKTLNISSSQTSTVISGLTSGQAYKITIKSYDSSGNESSGVSQIITAS